MRAVSRSRSSEISSRYFDQSLLSSRALMTSFTILTPEMMSPAEEPNADAIEKSGLSRPLLTPRCRDFSVAVTRDQFRL